MRCAQCGFVDHGNFCGNCGSSLERVSHGPLASVVHPVIEPVRLYFGTSFLIFQPLEFSQEIARGLIGTKSLIQFFISALVISSIINLGFQDSSSLNIPILTEALAVLIGISVAALYAVPLHLVLVLCKGVAPIKHTIATVFSVMAVVFPWMALATNLQALASEQAAEALQTMLRLIFWVFVILIYATLSHLHRIRKAILIPVGFVYTIVFIAVISLVIIELSP